MTAAVATTILGEVETPRPLRFPGGRVTLAGWCLVSGLARPPTVRLRTAALTVAARATGPRDDLPARFPGESAAARCGFSLEARHPAGVYVADFEAQLPDDSWRVFRSFTLTVESPPFAAALEEPLGAGTLRDKGPVKGWALRVDQPARELQLRYGHQSTAVAPAELRADLAEKFPDSPHAAAAGFTGLVQFAGFGPLRVRAAFADGSAAVAPTGVRIEIAHDQNHGPEIDLGAERIALPGYSGNVRLPPAPPAHGPTVLFLLPGSFSSNHALHVAALGNELAALGLDCAVAVAHDVGTLAHLGHSRLRGVLHAAAAAGAVFSGGREPDLVHAWTTRENVRQLATAIRARHPRTRVFVHLEDNEREILAHTLGRTPAELDALDDATLDRLVPPDLSHPRRSRAFLASADGVTVIVDRLREFVPAEKPCLTVRPAADYRYFYPRPRPDHFRRVLDIAENETVLLYPGNIHAANVAEMAELYDAVTRLNAGGTPVTLVRTGLDTVPLPAGCAAAAAPHVLHLGQILHHRHLAPLLALADIFVQPGRADAFNDYRFPSKLPEFFSVGRPVILPRTNLGGIVRHGIDAYVLETADAAGIASAVRELRKDRALSAQLGRGAAEFAWNYFNWARTAGELADFYRAVLARA